MDEKNHLLYFIHTQKDNLGFKNCADFEQNIKNSFDFRFKLQKYVYISKYFGWNNHYAYKLYIKGPYSTALAEDYYSKDLMKNNPLKINSFDLNGFNEFINQKDNHYLEAASTILFEKISSLDLAITQLNEIKPYITDETIERSFKNILKFKLNKQKFSHENFHNDLVKIKENLIERMEFYINYFEYFGECNNGILVAGSVDYLRIALWEEDLNDEMKSDLMDLTRKFLDQIETIYSMCDDNGELFANLNLDFIEILFDRFQDYISKDLCIIPRIDDDEFDESLCYR